MFEEEAVDVITVPVPDRCDRVPRRGGVIMCPTYAPFCYASGV